MRIFNRIVVILLLAGLFVLGVFVFLASIGPFLNALGAQGTDLQNLPSSLRPDGLTAGLRNYLTNTENGNVGVLDAVVLVAVALVGLILLVLELKPPTPRRERTPGSSSRRSGIGCSSTWIGWASRSATSRCRSSGQIRARPRRG